MTSSVVPKPFCCKRFTPFVITYRQALIRAFGSGSDQRFFLGGATFDKKVTRSFGHGQTIVIHIHDDKRKPIGGQIVRQNLPNPSVATNDGVLADPLDLTALFEFSKDFQDFSLCNETNDLADHENDGAGTADNDKHGEYFLPNIDQWMNFAKTDTEHRDHHHVNGIDQRPTKGQKANH
jgi:hypothetical protein